LGLAFDSAHLSWARRGVGLLILVIDCIEMLQMRPHYLVLPLNYLREFLLNRHGGLVANGGLRQTIEGRLRLVGQPRGNGLCPRDAVLQAGPIT
jgi:hypothetical protein